MEFKVLGCAVFGHNFTETSTSKEEFEGQWYIVEESKKCDRCGLSDVDISGRLGLANKKYGFNIKSGILKR